MSPVWPCLRSWLTRDPYSSLRLSSRRLLGEHLVDHFIPQTLGSIWWCINAILFFCYFSNTSLAFTNTEAATGFLGGTTFLVGSYLGWVESLNPAQEAHYDYDEDEPSK